jgi:Domain of unknown function (DUF2382)
VTDPLDDQVDLQTEAVLERTDDGWSIRLPVRSEAIHIRKRVVVSERVLVHRVVRSEIEHLDATIRREKLRVDTPSYDALDASARAELERDAQPVADAEAVETPSESPTGSRRQARRPGRRR